LIVSNPADKVELPRINKFVGSFYSEEEISRLFEAVRGTKIELAVHFAVFYGMRGSEVCGLKWDNIDFCNNCFTVADTVCQTYLDGQTVLIQKSRPKNQSSNRTYPLAPQHREMLERLQAQQKANQRACGRSYCKDYLAYVYVDEMGTLISANYISQRFHDVLQNHGLRRIRFHDLRHTCASLLLANGVSMKEIQDWLGHSDFSTTANIYAHLDFGRKLSSAQTMSSILERTDAAPIRQMRAASPGN
jgi:integrase